MLPLGRFFGCNETSDCQGRRRSHACIRDIPVVGYRVRTCLFGKVCTLVPPIVYRRPALRSPCGSNAEARRASCPELGLHVAGMVLPFAGVLSLGCNRI